MHCVYLGAAPRFGGILVFPRVAWLLILPGGGALTVNCTPLLAVVSFGPAVRGWEVMGVLALLVPEGGISGVVAVGGLDEWGRVLNLNGDVVGVLDEQAGVRKLYGDVAGVLGWL